VQLPVVRRFRRHQLLDDEAHTPVQGQGDTQAQDQDQGQVPGGQIGQGHDDQLQDNEQGHDIRPAAGMGPGLMTHAVEAQGQALLEGVDGLVLGGMEAGQRRQADEQQK
jgi:hypothetical protein